MKYKVEYSKTTNYSMDIKKSKLSTQKPYVHFKDDMSYNDKNDKKVNTDRPKTKYGKLVGSKINVKRVYADRKKEDDDMSDQYSSSTPIKSKNEVTIDGVRNYNSSSSSSFDTDRNSGNVNSNDDDASHKSKSSDTVERMKKEDSPSEPKTYPVSTGRSLGKGKGKGKGEVVGRKSPFTRQPLKKR